MIIGIGIPSSHKKIARMVSLLAVTDRPETPLPQSAFRCPTARSRAS
jgi:hypothetical protein